MKTLFTSLLLFTAFVASVRAQQAGDNKPPLTPPSAEDNQVCVLGNVRKPSAVSFKGTITLWRAVEGAGGVMPDLKSTQAFIIRRLPDGYVEMRGVKDLKALAAGRAADITLKPGDVVEVVPRRKGVKIKAPDRPPCGTWYVALKRFSMH